MGGKVLGLAAPDAGACAFAVPANSAAIAETPANE